MGRWIYKRRYTTEGSCTYCGTHTGGTPCAVTVCQACGSEQCMSHGGANGSCCICHHGLLRGWSGWNKHLCQVAGCENIAVVHDVPKTMGKRNGCLCAEHLDRVSVRVYWTWGAGAIPKKKVTVREYLDYMLRRRDNLGEFIYVP